MLQMSEPVSAPQAWMQHAECTMHFGICNLGGLVVIIIAALGGGQLNAMGHE